MSKKLASVIVLLLVCGGANAKLSDPMNPLLKVKERKLGMDLQAIGKRGDEPYCMIDGKMYKVGDTIKDLRIVEIKQGKIILRSDNNKLHELKL